MKNLIYFGGALWTLCFVFHIFFWKIFDWKTDLDSLTAVNKSIIQVLNLCLMLCFLVFAYISFFEADALLGTSLGRSLLAGMSLFGLFRFVEQFIFFNLRRFLSKLVLLGALLIAVVYAAALFV